MDNDITTRRIRSRELGELLDLYKHLHSADEHLDLDDNLRRLWDGIMADKNMHILVVVEQDTLVSSCVLAVIKNLTRGARPYAIIENVVTHYNHRLKGYGKQVIQEALKIAWQSRCYKVMLMTGRSDEGTLRFYENCGFVRGVKTGFIAYPQ